MSQTNHLTVAALCAVLALLARGDAAKPAAKRPVARALQAVLVTAPADLALLRGGKVLTRLKKDFVLKTGDVLRTGTKAVDFRIGDTATVRLKSASRLRIPTLLRRSKSDPRTIDNRLSLERGTLLTRLNHLFGQSRFIIVTPQVVTAARGTGYLVQATSRRTEVLVDEGAVAVHLPGSAEREVLVAAREKAAVEGEALPAKPEPLTEADERRVEEVRQLAVPRLVNGITTWGTGPAGSDAQDLVWTDARRLTMNDPQCITVGPDGTVYVGDAEAFGRLTVGSIWMIRRGKAARLIGPGRPGFNPRRPSLGAPTLIKVGAAGELLVVDDPGTRVSVVDAAGSLSGVAGTNEVGDGDGTLRAARFKGIHAMAVLGDGAIAVSDHYGDGYRLRLIRRAGVTTPLVEGKPVLVQMLAPLGGQTLAALGVGNLVTRIDLASGQVGSLLTARLTAGNRPWVDGPADVATLHEVRVIAAAAGLVYVDQGGYNVIRVLDPARRTVGTAAGTGFAESVDGPANRAAFDRIKDLAVGPGGDLFILEGNTHRVRVLGRDGEVRTLSGQDWKNPNPSPYGVLDGTAATARMLFPEPVGRSAAGDWYFFDHYHRLRRLTVAGRVETVAGSGRPGERTGRGTEADVWPSQALAPDGTVLHLAGDGVREYAPDGQVRDGYRFPLGNIRALTVDAAGAYYIEQDQGALYRVKPGAPPELVAGERGQIRSVDGKGRGARFGPIEHLRAGAQGVYVIEMADVGKPTQSARIIRLVQPDGTVRTIAGSPLTGSRDGRGVEATLRGVSWPGVDAAGDLYVLDGPDGAIRRITAEGVVTTLAPRLPLPPNTHFTGFGVEPDGRFLVAIYPPGRLLRLRLPNHLEVVAGPPLP